MDLALVSALSACTATPSLLHRWRDAVHLFNRRLDQTETARSRTPSRPPSWRRSARALHRENSYFAATREMIENLLTRLPPA